MQRYVFAIDTAYANNGACLAEEGKLPVFTDRANMLVTGNGEIYNTYEEKYSFEYAYKYVIERIQTMQAAQLIIIEKALIKDDQNRFIRDPSESMRANVVLERNLYSIISMFHIMGYLPPVLVVSPEKWQHVLGIPKMSYQAHKQKSCEMFAQMTSPAFVESIKMQYFDRKYDDIAEAYLITQAAHKDFDKWYKEATTYHNHDAHISNLGARITREQRMAPLPKITDDIKFVDGHTRYNWLVQHKRSKNETKMKKIFKGNVLEAVKASTNNEPEKETTTKGKKKPVVSPVQAKEKSTEKKPKSKKKVKVITMSDEEDDCVLVDDSDLEF